ncbi:MAG TPA: hypothetical protein VN253_19125 [Kofleriaceae bacterium]|nr:hypothetical protein [Kofleriaceae bacterium]
MIRANLPIVTFIAAAPSQLPGGSYDPELAGNLELHSGIAIDPQRLDEISTHLLSEEVKAVIVPTPGETTRKQRPRHMLARVSNVIEMMRWLDLYFRANPNPDKRIRIQVIGHAQSGSISLGANWLPRKYWYSYPYYVFDSNPRALLFLGRFVNRVDEVVLAGCFAGSWHSNGFEVNGRTLMFTLAEMWKCKVRGADEAVSVEGFDNQGWYVGKEVDPVGWVWNVQKGSATHEPQKRELQFVEKQLSKPKSIAAYGQTFNDAATLDELCDYFNAEADETHRPRLALPELELELNYQDGNVRAWLLCGGRFLLVDEPAGKICYTNQARSARKLPPRPALLDLVSQVASLEEAQIHKAA